MTDATWRHQLMQRRHTLARSSPSFSECFTHLSDWINDQIDASWQTLEQLFGPTLEPAFAFRDDAAPRAIRRVKALRFADQILLLSLDIESDDPERMGIRVQLFAIDRTQPLPPGFTLTLTSDQGEVIQSVEARDNDDRIQLRRFRVPIGTRFRIDVTGMTSTVSEPFKV